MYNDILKVMSLDWQSDGAILYLLKLYQYLQTVSVLTSKKASVVVDVSILLMVCVPVGKFHAFISGTPA